MVSPTTDRRLGLVGNTPMKAPVQAATTGSITLSGEQTIDGVAVVAANAAGVPDRVLVKNQASAVQNGIYDVSTGSWTRSKDANGNYDLVKGTTIFVTGGSTNGSSYWYVNATNPITMDSTEISFIEALTDSASTLSFLQAGTGAVSRSAQDKMREKVTLADFGTLAEAITAAAGKRLVIQTPVSLTGNTTVPATVELVMEAEGLITTTGFTLTVNGPFSAGLTQCFTGSGTVKFAHGTVPWILPQWFGAVGDAAVDASTGTDSATAFTRAVAATCEDGVSDVSIHMLLVPGGNYIVGALAFPPAFHMVGAGRHQTSFIAKTGTTGEWFEDAGNAAKIMLEGFAMYARSLTGITYGLRLGYGSQQHGTEGYVRDIWVRDVDGASAVWGIDINGNVGRYSGLVAQDCTSGLRIVGVANEAAEIVVYAPITTGLELNLCNARGVEIEAPGNSCLPIKLAGNADVSGAVVSLANGTTISHLVELGASCTTWAVRGFNLAFGNTPAGITVSNGNFKRADGTYFGGNATAGSRNGEGNYSSTDAGQILQSFSVRITNTAGTMQHRIATPGGNASNFVASINGASSALTNTPTGADASTAMAAGAKIGATTPSILWLDTVSQKEADLLALAAISFNSTGTALTVLPFATSININGVTRTRFGLQFFNLSGTAFALNTANITAGQIVQATVLCYLAN